MFSRSSFFSCAFFLLVYNLSCSIRGIFCCLLSSLPNLLHLLSFIHLSLFYLFIYLFVFLQYVVSFTFFFSSCFPTLCFIHCFPHVSCLKSGLLSLLPPSHDAHTSTKQVSLFSSLTQQLGCRLSLYTFTQPSISSLHSLASHCASSSLLIILFPFQLSSSLRIASYASHPSLLFSFRIPLPLYFLHTPLLSRCQPFSSFSLPFLSFITTSFNFYILLSSFPFSNTLNTLYHTCLHPVSSSHIIPPLPHFLSLPFLPFLPHLPSLLADLAFSPSTSF